jgi:hypothetical protein
MKIKLSELKQIIQEEATRYKKAIELKLELEEINRQLNEVHAGGVMATDGTSAGQKEPIKTVKSVPGSQSKAIVETGLDAETGLDTEVEVGNDSEYITKEELARAIEDLKLSLNLPDISDDTDAVDTDPLKVDMDVDVDMDSEDGTEMPSDDSEEVASVDAMDKETGAETSTDSEETEEEPTEDTDDSEESSDEESDEDESEEESESPETLQESEEKKRWKYLAGIDKKSDDN